MQRGSFTEVNILSLKPYKEEYSNIDLAAIRFPRIKANNEIENLDQNRWRNRNHKKVHSIRDTDSILNKNIKFNFISYTL